MPVTLLTPFGAFIAPTEPAARRLAAAVGIREEHFRGTRDRAVRVAYDDTYEVAGDRIRLYPHLTLTELLFSREELQDHVRDVARRYFQEARP